MQVECGEKGRLHSGCEAPYYDLHCNASSKVRVAQFCGAMTIGSIGVDHGARDDEMPRCLEAADARKIIGEIEEAYALRLGDGRLETLRTILENFSLR